MDDGLRDNLLCQANDAFLTLMGQANILLDAAQVFLSKKKPERFMDQVKRRELQSAVFDLGSIPPMLVGEITRWKKGHARVLSRQGVELNLLNELYANMESMMLFFMREGVEVPEFSLDAVKIAHYELLRCNRLL